MVEHVVAVFVLCALVAIGLLGGWWLAGAIAGGLLAAFLMVGLCAAASSGDAHLMEEELREHPGRDDDVIVRG